MKAPKTYRFSALASGLFRMWRAWSVIIPVVVVNALAQGALVASPSTNGISAADLALAAVSALLFLLGYGLVLSSAVQVADGRVSWRAAIARLRERLGPFVLATLGLGLAALVALSIHTIPGWIVLGVGVFVPTAAMAGPGNPVAAGLRAIGRRPLRWLVTIAITGLIVILGSYLMGVNAFFLRGFAASALVWFIGGFVVSWLTVAFALVFRSAQDAARLSPSSPAEG